MTVPYPATTFASDEEREVYELRKIAEHDAALAEVDTRLVTAETTITDHEARIDTLEAGGGGGGMTEEMYAEGFGIAFVTGTGTGQTGAGTWSAGSTGGTDPPEIDPGDSTLLLVAADGYHLMTVGIDGQGAMLAGESATAVISVLRGMDVEYTYLPLQGTGTGTLQRDQRTVGLRLLDGDALSAEVYHNSLVASRTIVVVVGLSRIGGAIDPAPIGL